MKKKLFSLAIASMLIAGCALSSCQTATQKEEAAQDKVQNAQQDLNVAQNNANVAKQKVATADEFKTFKLESELKIKNNEVTIAELNLKMKKSGSALNKVYTKKIVALEKKNQEMKTRIDSYEKSHSDWETFRREFNHDMIELGDALKDLSVDNKK